MKVRTGEQLSGYFGSNEALVCEDVQFVGCEILSGAFGSNDLTTLSRLRRLGLCDCTVQGFHLNLAALEDVDIDRLTTRGMLMAYGTLFRRTRLRGKVGTMILNPFRPPESGPGTSAAEWAGFAKEFYQNTDWALDISEAVFDDAAIRSMPLELVRRDPVSQAIVRRDAIERAGWEHPAVVENRAAFDSMVVMGLHETLILAPKGNKKRYGVVMGRIERLRAAGIAEPG